MQVHREKKWGRRIAGMVGVVILLAVPVGSLVFFCPSFAAPAGENLAASIDASWAFESPRWNLLRFQLDNEVVNLSSLSVASAGDVISLDAWNYNAICHTATCP